MQANIGNQKKAVTIRLSEKDWELCKLAAGIEQYGTLTEFFRRTGLLEAQRIVQQTHNLQMRSSEKVKEQ
ncbi:MAG: hypothetical protein IKO41_01265 [Lachnospiraceae bacterium]|nr:hypothetical protein [Lachnospiraceae bacterium]